MSHIYTKWLSEYNSLLIDFPSSSFRDNIIISIKPHIRSLGQPSIIIVMAFAYEATLNSVIFVLITHGGWTIL